MKRCFTTTFFCCLVSLLVSFCGTQKVHAQPTSIHDSLYLLLNYFQDSIKDEKVKQAAKETLALYKSEKINDSLAVKLLGLEDILIKDLHIHRPLIFPFAQVMVQLFEQVTDKKNYIYYATSLSNLAR